MKLAKEGKFEVGGHVLNLPSALHGATPEQIKRSLWHVGAERTVASRTLPGPAPKLPGTADVPPHPGRREGDIFNGNKVYDQRVHVSHLAGKGSLKGVSQVVSVLEKQTSRAGKEYYTCSWATVENGKPGRTIYVTSRGQVNVPDWHRINEDDWGHTIHRDPHEETVDIPQVKKKRR